MEDWASQLEELAMQDPPAVPPNVMAARILSVKVQSMLLNPRQHAKAGRVVTRMRLDGFEDWAINDVVLALVTPKPEEMQKAFDLFAGPCCNLTLALTGTLIGTLLGTLTGPICR